MPILRNIFRLVPNDVFFFTRGHALLCILIAIDVAIPWLLHQHHLFTMDTIATETPPKKYRIGIITASNRPVRAGPQIAAFVHSIISSHHSQLQIQRRTRVVIEWDAIDIATLNLPLCDEPGVPQHISHRPDGYEHAHTRAWSARVAGLDGFVFVTPQYNWGIPAGLKNAIDYLFHEWTGKPALVVSYGGRGGEKCARQLTEVLGGGLRMRVSERKGMVNLAFGARDVTERAARGEDLGLLRDGKEGEEPAAEGGLWSDKREEIVEAWEEFLGLLQAKIGGVDVL